MLSEQENQNLKKQLAEKDKRIANESKKRDKRMNELQSNLDAEKDAADSLRVQNERQQKQIKDLEEKLSISNTALAHEKGLNSEILQQSNQKDKEMKKVEKQKESYDLKLAELQSQIEALQKANQRSQKELDLERQKSSELTNRLDEFQISPTSSACHTDGSEELEFNRHACEVCKSAPPGHQCETCARDQSRLQKKVEYFLRQAQTLQQSLESTVIPGMHSLYSRLTSPVPNTELPEIARRLGANGMYMPQNGEGDIPLWSVVYRNSLPFHYADDSRQESAVANAMLSHTIQSSLYWQNQGWKRDSVAALVMQSFEHHFVAAGRKVDSYRKETLTNILRHTSEIMWPTDDPPFHFLNMIALDVEAITAYSDTTHRTENIAAAFSVTSQWGCQKFLIWPCATHQRIDCGCVADWKTQYSGLHQKVFPETWDSKRIFHGSRVDPQEWIMLKDVNEATIVVRSLLNLANIAGGDSPPPFAKPDAAILVGHGLENDIKWLNLVPNYEKMSEADQVRYLKRFDTVSLYKRHGRDGNGIEKPGLQLLVKQLLGHHQLAAKRTHTQAHDCADDALYALALVLHNITPHDDQWGVESKHAVLQMASGERPRKMQASRSPGFVQQQHHWGPAQHQWAYAAHDMGRAWVRERD